MGASLVPVVPGAHADEVTLLNPQTGEVVGLDAPTEDLAEVLRAVREWEQSARMAKQLISAALHARMDFEGTLTLRAGGFTLKGSPPTKTLYDGERLAGVLGELAAEGLISPRAVAEAVQPVVTYKPSVMKLKQLHKLGGRVAEAIDECVTVVPNDRRVTVSGGEGV